MPRRASTKVGAGSRWDSPRLTGESARYPRLSLPAPDISIPAFVVSVAESKTERKCFLADSQRFFFKPARAARAVGLPQRDCRRRAVVGPGAHAESAPVRCRSATIGIFPWTSVWWRSRTLGRRTLAV